MRMINYIGIKDILEVNWYLNDLSKRIMGRKYNEKIEEFTLHISSIDSIQNVEKFKMELQKLPSTLWNSTYTIKRAFGGNSLYGYAVGLLDYSDLSMKDLFFCPLLEHGISYDLDDNYLNTFAINIHSAYIFQGRYKEKIWKKYSKKKAYFVGPYIHYARNYYSEKKIEELKKKNGHTLLVFPPHSTEIDTLSFEASSFNRLLLDCLAPNYRTVIACIFWKDLSDEYTKFLIDHGVQIVSAGFKLDNRFVSRLKTIISISDDVLYPSFNSSIGYAYYMNKKVLYAGYDDRISYSSSSAQKGTHSLNNIACEFAKAFSLDDDMRDETLQMQLVEKYWGLSEVKRQDEIRAIILENKQHIRRSFGF